MNDKISIIVPVYNVEAYLQACIDSLLAQTYQNLEILLVDDGSTDSSNEICKKNANIYENVKLLEKENGGLSDARNYGICHASGSYLMFVDSDDTMVPAACAVLMEALQKSQAAMSIGELYTDEKAERKTGMEIINYEADEALAQMLTETTFNTSACGKLYKKELFDSIRFPVGMLFEDLGTIYKVLYQAKGAVYIPYDVYFYRTRENSITHASFNPRKMDFFQITKEIMDFLEENCKGAIPAAVNRRTRYAISFLKEIALDGGEDSPYVEELRGYVKAGIRSYLRSSYKWSSKLFGAAIVVNYPLACRMMRKTGR